MMFASKNIIPVFRLGFVFCFILVILSLAACAPVTYNRYQTAHTIGEGNWKAAVSAEVGRDLVGPADFELKDRMEDKLWDFSRKNNLPVDFENEIADLFGDFTMIMLSASYAGLGYATPMASLHVAYGVTDNVDLEFGLAANGYFHGNAKVQLMKFGEHGAMALAPGGGFLMYSSPVGEESEGRYTAKDDYSGYVMNLEAPLLIGWQYTYVSPYLGIHNSYHHVSIDYHRVIEDISPTFDETINLNYDVYNIGAVLGLQLKFSKFILTPEITGIYAIPLQSEIIPVAFFSPGLAIGGQW